LFFISKEQHLFEAEIFVTLQKSLLSILNNLTHFFLNKSIHLLSYLIDYNLLNSNVYYYNNHIKTTAY